MLDEQIINCRLSIAAKKDFGEEFRALVDVKKFVSDSFILFDITEVRINSIVGKIIDRLVECRGLGSEVASEARSLLFIDTLELNVLLANTMQGLYKSRVDGRLAYDNSWVVATASLLSLHSRQVAIARFPQPVNFGRQSQEVRFLIIVLAPNKEKQTKSAWETGRTFATMFTDISFRRRLLRAKTQEEFKSDLLARAEKLAEESEIRAHKNCCCYKPTGNILSISSLPNTVEPTKQSEALSAGPNAMPVEAHPQGIITSIAIESNKQNEEKSSASAVLASKTADLYPISAGAGAGAASPEVTLEEKREKFANIHNVRMCHNCSDQDSQTSSLQERGRNCLSALGTGLVRDFKRRSKYYVSDFTDGIFGERSLYKTISTTVFLYFSVLLPCVAFGVVDTNNTDGQIDPKKTMIGQALGGLFFGLFSGQPLIVVMTTAPLCIYVKVIYQVSQDFETDFGAFYACVGLWMAFFLVLMSLSNSSNLMKYCTRSTEDIFALFTAFAFGSDGVKEAIRSFNKYYWEPDCQMHGSVLVSRTMPESGSLHQLPLPSSLLAANDPSTTSSQQLLASPSISFTNANGTTNNNIASRISSSLEPAPSSFRLQQRAAENLSSTASHIQATYTTSPAALNLASSDFHSNLSALLLQSGDQSSSAAATTNDLLHTDLGSSIRCQRETCILFLFLMCGTLWLANSFSSFNKTPYLSYKKREMIKDYALAISVLIFSFVGSYLFMDIRLDVFEFSDYTGLHVARLQHLSWPAVLVCCGLGFMLSVLFYIDQNICGAMVNNAPYKLKKGDYFHLDLLVLAILNTVLSLVGLPWMHGKLPHSHLHAKALADYEERVDEGHVHQTIVNIRETRLTSILCSLLVALSLLAIPYPLSYIPLPVLSGVFLYTALAEFKSNSLVERVCLLFTEQAAYPPNHYIRRCPQRKIHLFTMIQLAQLAVVSFIGFYPNPYVNMAFPLAVATFVPFRDRLLPRLIDAKYLNSLDSASLE